VGLLLARLLLVALRLLAEGREPARVGVTWVLRLTCWTSSSTGTACTLLLWLLVHESLSLWPCAAEAGPPEALPGGSSANPGAGSQPLLAGTAGLLPAVDATLMLLLVAQAACWEFVGCLLLLLPGSAAHLLLFQRHHSHQEHKARHPAVHRT